MARYLLGRLLGAIPLVLGIATVVFFILALAPGDPVLLLTGPGATPEVVEEMRRSLALDRPVHERYLDWMGSLLQGDLGTSIRRHQPVREVIAQILPNTLILSGTALVLAFLLGTLIGVVQAVRQNSAVDHSLSVVALFFYSMPSFWLALMLILLFSLGAGSWWGWPIWFPASGMTSVDHAFLGPVERVMDRARHLVLPATALALVLAAGVSRYMRGSMLEVIHQDYVRTARAKGLPERTVILKHVFRNALIPVVTLLGLYLPFLFSGAVFVETVFAWPGMGRVIVDATLQRDFPLVMGCALAFAVLVVMGNLLADLLYAVVDPRIRYD
jgi:peptide/nickel transport system permease protein